MSQASVARRALELRRSFDEAFQSSPPEHTTELVDLLAVRVGHVPCAVRVRQLSGVFVDRPITALPTPVIELVGITGFRGVIYPVYDLARLLGFEARGGRRSLLLVASKTPLALAFDRLEGHLRAPRADIAVAGASDVRAHVREMVAVAGIPRPILDLPSVLDAIRGMAGVSSRRRER